MKRRGILGVFLVSSALLISGINFSYTKNSVTNEETVAPSEPGNVFYAADFATDIKNEPKYSEQKTKTFDSMSFNYTPQVYRGNSVKVAVIDSGINYNHEDFGTIQGVSRALEYDYTNAEWDEYTYSTNPSKINDTLGHGTNVASVIASQINGKGVAGIAPNVELYIYKVTNSSNGYEWGAIQTAINDCITRKIDVINMSFQAYEQPVSYGSSSLGASEGCSTILSSWLNRAYNAGITLVGAAGNYNTNEPSYPASNDHVISVGSLANGSTTTKAGFSNTYGIDLVAPGYVTTAEKGSTNAYKETQGTSFSAPIVTAAIALYKQKNPSATPADVESALYDSCDPVEGNPTWAGHGRLNIDKLLGLNENSPQSFNISNVDDTLELEVGDEFQLDYSILPSSFNEGIEYTTAMGDCVSVSDTGLITALAEGEDFLSIYPKGYPTLCKEFDIVVNSKQSYDPMPESPIELSTVDLLTAPSGNNWTTNNLSSYCGSATANKNGSFSVTYSLATDFADLDFSRIESSTLTVIVGGGSNSGTGGITVSLSNNSSSTQTFPSDTSATNLQKKGNYRKTFTFTNETAFNSITISAPAKFYLIDFSYKFEFTVKGSGSTTPTVSSVSIVNPTGSNQLTVGNTLSLSATVTGTNNPSQTVTWSSSNTSYATVSDSGLVTAIAAGNVTITATSTVNTSKTGTLNLTIVAATTTSYTVTFNANGGSLGSNPSTKTVDSGTSITLPTLTRSDYTFKGWDESSTSQTASLSGGSLYTVLKNVTLYAIWETSLTPISDEGTYYNGITSTSGLDLLGELHDLSIENHTTYTNYSGSGIALNTTYFFKTDRYENTNQVIDFWSGTPTNNAGNSGQYDGWNREHVWPKSLTNDTFEETFGGSDIQHLRPTIPQGNSDHGSKPYGELTGSYSVSQDSSKGIVFGHYTSSVFEPMDNKKGDTARILMYVYMHYNKASNIHGTKDGSCKVGNLNFADVVVGNESQAIATLLKWNAEDEVDSIEITRNSEAAKITGCRNPFIDHPEYADAIWGTPTTKTLDSISLSGSYKTEFTIGDTFSYSGLIVTASYTSGSPKEVTPTSVSVPDMTTTGDKTITVSYTEGGVTKYASYTISVKSGSVTPDPVKHTTALSLDKTTASVNVGETLTLVATKTPSDSVDGVTWSTSDSSVATVSNGVVTGVKAGTATITATSNDIPATCGVEVKAQSTAGETVQASIDFTNSNSTDIDDLNNTWTTTGSCTTGSYLRLNSNSTQVKSSNINIDTGKTVSVSLNLGYFGGTGVSVEVYAVNSSGTTITNTLNLSPTTNGNKAYTGTLTFTASDNPINFVIKAKGTSTSGSGKYVRFYGGSFEYTEKSNEPIKVNSITVSNKPTSIEQSKFIDISITIGPNDATDKSVTWLSSNSSAIGISNTSSTGARLTASGSIGSKSTITITAQDGSGVSTSFEVTIVEKVVLIGITYSGKTTYAKGSSMSNSDGHLIYANYSDGTEKNVTSLATITGFDSSKEQLNKVNVSYTEDGITKTTSQQLLILENINSGQGEAYYQKVTSTTDLTDGQYLIVYETGNLAFNGALTTLDAIENTVDTGNITDNKITATDTLNRAAFTFTKSDGSFKGSGGMYFGNASDSNALTSSSSVLKNTVTLSGTDVSIKSVGGSYLRYNNGDGQNRFRYYKSSSYTNQQAIQIYKYVEGQSSLTTEQKAKVYSATFLNGFTCDGSGIKGPTFAAGVTWTSLKTEYNKLDSDTKALFESATYIRTGSDIEAAGGTNIVIASAVARYDFVVHKYGYEDFMNRGISSSRYNPVVSLSEVDSTTIIISVVALAGLAAIGGLLFYKKRKEQ